MDFERASIKALFYDYPVETVVKAIEDARRNKDGYIDILPQLVRWREEAFTTTEARLMENLAQDEWMNLNESNALTGYDDEPDATKIPFIYRPFLLVRYMANKMIEQNPKTLQPNVVFEELIRWKDATLFVGEDLFTTAYLANKDLLNKENNKRTQLFAWPDYISHNNVELNEVLKRGLTDVHAHYNATCDVFSLNWIDLMNSLNGKEEKLRKIEQYQDVTLSTVGTEQLYTLKRMCIAAAFLRLQFFKLLNNLYTKDDDPRKKIKCVKLILEDEFCVNKAKREIDAEISVWRSYALRGRNGSTIDYALIPSQEVKKHIKDANLIFHGERQLMYLFFYRFFGFDSQIWALAPYFYLYIVLKTRIRKEFIQINQLKGFENFETYQDRKDIFINSQDPIAKLFDPIVLQTTLRGENDRLEGRVTPKELMRMVKGKRLRVRNYGNGVFQNRQVIPNAADHLSLVVHFIKANYSKSAKANDLRLSNRQDYARFDKYRKDLKEQIHEVLKVYDKQKKGTTDIRVVGIDAASTEMFCRPEVFGHAFRFARKKGLSNQTYHVGEDFFDIVDGLRAIDEAMLFLGLDSHCRIGHGLAMGIDAKQYYENRHYRIIAPKQYVLDNCVWLCMTASREDVELPNSLETELNRLARELYKEIGYNCNRKHPFDMQTYWNSMLLRGDEPENALPKTKISFLAKATETDWQKTKEVDAPMVDIARKDIEAAELYQLYHFNHNVKAKGEKRFQGKYPATIVEVVEQLQAKIRLKVDTKQIALETNPSSNLKIGFVDKYCEHPLLTKFDPVESQSDPYYPLLNASVNTDDRGVFATTVYNELSLIALSMMKLKNNETGEAKYGTRQIMEYIDHLRKAGEQQRFKI